MATAQKRESAGTDVRGASTEQSNDKVNIYALKYKTDLGPNDTDVYFAQLDEIMKNKELQNIALAGPRGAGKSSIIHSYDNKRNEGERFLYISLADFEGDGVETEKSTEQQSKEASSQIQKKFRINMSGESLEKMLLSLKQYRAEWGKRRKTAEEPLPQGNKEKKPKEDKIALEENEAEKDVELVSLPKRKSLHGKDGEAVQKKLEFSMLSQILAKCTKEDLRSSSLQAISEVCQNPRKKRWKYVFAFALFMLISGLVYEERFGLLLRMMNTPDMVRIILHAAGYLVAFVMLFWGVVYLVCQKPGLFRFGKLALKTPLVDAEISPSQNIFCLDHYRFELIHILNQLAPKIGYTVVIEDLDLVEEYDAAVVLSKLRELNLWVNTHREEQCRKQKKWFPKSREKNNSKIAKLDQPIRFIYAISDITFNADDRTKFFDTILPVTPALNHTNAFGFIKNAFTGDIKISTVDSQIMTLKMSQAIIDYRQLNDIRTEYEFFSRWYVQAQGKGSSNEEEKYRIERELLAIAVYKVLLPQEYYYAFTRDGGGELMNPKKKRLECRDYDKRVVELIDFLFSMKYLNALSLTRVGYSRVAIRHQWAEILLNGTEEAQIDLLNRFDPDASGQTWKDENQKEHTLGETLENIQGFTGEKLPKNASIRVLEMATQYLFVNATDALQFFYGKLYDSDLKPEGLANLLICLGCYNKNDKNGNNELTNAKGEINRHTSDGQKEKFEEKYKRRLKKEIDKAKKEYKNNENLKAKFKHVEPVIRLLLDDQNYSLGEEN